MSHWTKVVNVYKLGSRAIAHEIALSKRVKVRGDIKRVGKAESSALFMRACEMAEIPPTRRQFSKWSRNAGLANTFRAKARRANKGN